MDLAGKLNAIRERFSHQWPLGNVSAAAISGDPIEFSVPHLEDLANPPLQWIDYVRPASAGGAGSDPASGWDVRFASSDALSLERFLVTAEAAGLELREMLEHRFSVERCFAKRPARLWVRSLFLASDKLGVDGVRERFYFDPEGGRRQVMLNAQGELDPGISHELLRISDLVAASIAMLEHLGKQPEEPTPAKKKVRRRGKDTDTRLREWILANPQKKYIATIEEIAKAIDRAPSTVSDCETWKSILPEREALQSHASRVRKLTKAAKAGRATESEQRELERLEGLGIGLGHDLGD